MTVIDEEWLESALHDLGAAIEVPEDGPAQVLAARRALARPSRPPRADRPAHRRRWPIAVGVAATLVAVVGIGLLVSRRSQATVSGRIIGNSARSAPTSTGSTTNGLAAQSYLPALPPGALATAPSTTVPPTPLGAPTGSVDATKIVKTGTLDLQVAKGQLTPAVNQLTSLVGGLGGYVADATTNEGSGAPTGALTLRVPVNQFENLLDGARALGKPLSQTTSGQDVTASYVNLAAQIQALDATQTQFEQILSKATSIGDILNVEQQITQVQTQIDQLQGQENVLTDQASFSTLTVQLAEVGSTATVPPTSPTGLALAWARARHSFARGVEDVIAASGGIVVFLLGVGLLFLIGRLTWPIVRRRLV